jgi:hypothetical protein
MLADVRPIPYKRKKNPGKRGNQMPGPVMRQGKSYHRLPLFTALLLSLENRPPLTGRQASPHFSLISDYRNASNPEVSRSITSSR